LSGACYLSGVLDNMTYTYTAGSNKISSIADAALATQGGFRASSGAFTYDVNGNQISNAAKGITSITYNHLNLPSNITLSGSRTIDFTYAADGTKLRKVVKTGATINLVQEYVNGIEYRGTAIPATTIEGIYHAEGRLYNNAGTWQREYIIKDHLGDTRITYCDINNDGVIATPSEILQENNYDAFGYGLDGVYMNHSNPDNLYQYNGKEKNDDHGIGMYDYGARWYDAGVGSFNTKDPMASKYSMLSPYAFVANNPIRFLDPDGNDIVDPKGKHVQITYKKDGTLGFSKNATSDIQKVANALNSTETGRGQLKKLDKSSVYVKINISSETNVTKDGNKTAYTYGETEQGNKKYPPSFGQYIKKDGSLGISVAKITIFEGSINEGIKEGSGLKLEGLTMDQAIGAVAGHEIVCATDQSEISKDLKDSQGKPRKDDREAKPNKIENKIIEEAKKNNN
jgi:RHS repeat-associated protein